MEILKRCLNDWAGQLDAISAEMLQRAKFEDDDEYRIWGLMISSIGQEMGTLGGHTESIGTLPSESRVTMYYRIGANIKAYTKDIKRTLDLGLGPVKLVREDGREAIITTEEDLYEALRV